MTTLVTARPAVGRSRSRLWFVSKLLIAAVTIVVAAGAAFQFSETEWGAHLYPPPGKLVDIGGQRLHINCTGEGSPTVIMDAGLGDTSFTWQLVQPEVSKFTRVCSYDRAGYGWSDAPNEARTSSNIAGELDRLLIRAAVPGPYVLVGHSFGGYNIRMFASRHRDQVAGMVFVDSSHPDQLNRFPPSGQPASIFAHYKFGIWTMPLGVPRILGWCRDDYTFPNQPADWARIAPEAIALDCRLLSWRTELAELREFRDNGRMVAATSPLGDIPVVVLSHDPQVGIGFSPADVAKAERAWTEMQEELRGLSSKSKRIVAKGSGHYVEIYRPDLVIAAVREIVTDARGTTPFQATAQTVDK
jgi:pimeloyl-ACP methyl ester carboxylesterase